MDYVHVPTHQLDLKPKDRRIIAVIRENELDSISICHQDKSRTEQHMAILVDGPVPREALTKVGV